LADPVPAGIVFAQAGQVFTTSLAIAEGTQNEHRAVIQLVRTYQADLEEFGRVAFEMRPFETGGGVQSREVAQLNEQQSTLLLTYMRNSDVVRVFKKRLVKAFWELANSQKADPMAVLNDPVAMRGLLLNYSEKVLILETKVTEQAAVVAQQAPKVAALDQLCTVSEGSICLRDAAKVLGLREKPLFQYLAASGWIYRRPGKSGWLAYSKVLAAGYMEHKIYTYESEASAEPVVRMSLLITAKGMAAVAKEYAKPGDTLAPLPTGGDL
jgi:phage antirepressor YoqD-like protein